MYYVDPSPIANAIKSDWKKNTHAGCNLCCLRLGLINSPVSFAVMRLRCKLVHDAEKCARHCQHAHNINELKHLINKLRSWQSQYLRYVAGNHRKFGKALNKVWHVVDDVQKNNLAGWRLRFAVGWMTARRGLESLTLLEIYTLLEMTPPYNNSEN